MQGPIPPPTSSSFINNRMVAAPQRPLRPGPRIGTDGLGENKMPDLQDSACPKDKRQARFFIDLPRQVFLLVWNCAVQKRECFNNFEPHKIINITLINTKLYREYPQFCFFTSHKATWSSRRRMWKEKTCHFCFFGPCSF